MPRFEPTPTTVATATKANGLTSASTTVAVSSATAPSANQALVATSSTAATWQSISTDYYHTIARIDTASTWTTAPQVTTQDAATVTLNSDGYWLFDATSVSDSAAAMYAKHTEPWGTVNFYNRKFRISGYMRVRMGSSNSSEAFLGTIDRAPSVKSVIPLSKTARHVGFFVEEVAGTRACYASNADGTTQTSTNITVQIADDAWLQYYIDFDGVNDIIRYYINGTLVATHTTNIPTGTNGANGTSLLVSIGNTGAIGGVAPYLRLLTAQFDMTVN